MRYMRYATSFGDTTHNGDSTQKGGGFVTPAKIREANHKQHNDNGNVSFVMLLTVLKKLTAIKLKFPSLFTEGFFLVLKPERSLLESTLFSFMHKIEKSSKRCFHQHQHQCPPLLPG